VGEPGAVVIAFVIDEDLGFVIEPPEGGRMQDPVAIAGIERAGRTWRLGDAPAAALPLIDGIGGKRLSLRGRASNRVNSTLSFAVPVD